MGFLKFICEDLILRKILSYIEDKLAEVVSDKNKQSRVHEFLKLIDLLLIEEELSILTVRLILILAIYLGGKLARKHKKDDQ